MNSPRWWSYENRSYCTLMPRQTDKKMDNSLTEWHNNIQSAAPALIRQDGLARSKFPFLWDRNQTGQRYRGADDNCDMLRKCRVADIIAKTILRHRRPLECVMESYFLCIQWRIYLSSFCPLFALFLLFLWLPISLLVVLINIIIFYILLSFSHSQSASGDRWRQAPPALALSPLAHFMNITTGQIFH